MLPKNVQNKAFVARVSAIPLDLCFCLICTGSVHCYVAEACIMCMWVRLIGDCLTSYVTWSIRNIRCLNRIVRAILRYSDRALLRLGLLYLLSCLPSVSSLSHNSHNRTFFQYSSGFSSWKAQLRMFAVNFLPQSDDSKICVVMVGLPARGKSLIAGKGKWTCHP